MKVEYRYRKTNEWKAVLEPIRNRKELKEAKLVIMKGGSFKSGRWEGWKSGRELREIISLKGN